VSRPGPSQPGPPVTVLRVAECRAAAAAAASSRDSDSEAAARGSPSGTCQPDWFHCQWHGRGRGPDIRVNQDHDSSSLFIWAGGGHKTHSLAKAWHSVVEPARACQPGASHGHRHRQGPRAGLAACTGSEPTGSLRLGPESGLSRLSARASGLGLRYAVNMSRVSPGGPPLRVTEAAGRTQWVRSMPTPALRQPNRTIVNQVFKKDDFVLYIERLNGRPEDCRKE
jgi:hypothetical protein